MQVSLSTNIALDTVMFGLINNRLWDTYVYTCATNIITTSISDTWFLSNIKPTINFFNGNTNAVNTD